MPNRIMKIIMNGVTGRMGRAQHLARSIVAIRQQGGLQLRNGETLWPEPILVSRNGLAGAGLESWRQRRWIPVEEIVSVPVSVSVRDH
jgi:hypothetical protein